MLEEMAMTAENWSTVRRLRQNFVIEVSVNLRTAYSDGMMTKRSEVEKFTSEEINCKNKLF